MILIYRKKDNELENILNKNDKYKEDKGKEWLKDGDLTYLSLTEDELKKYFKESVLNKTKTNESLNPMVSLNESSTERTYDYSFLINERGDVIIDAIDYDWSYVMKEEVVDSADFDDFVNNKMHDIIPFIIADDVAKREHIEGYPDAFLKEFEFYDDEILDMGYFTIKMTFETKEEPDRIFDVSDKEDYEILF